MLKGLLVGVGDHRVLSMKLLLAQFFHAGLVAALRADENHAEALRLAINAVLVKLDVEQVVDADLAAHLVDVCIRSPLHKGGWEGSDWTPDMAHAYSDDAQ